MPSRRSMRFVIHRRAVSFENDRDHARSISLPTYNKNDKERASRMPALSRALGEAVSAVAGESDCSQEPERGETDRPVVGFGVAVARGGGGPRLVSS